jgi:Kef-type K+ transport system membrane component KefB
MDTHNFLLDLMLILLAARVMAEVATRLKSPSVIGELLAGVVLGPSLLGWMTPDETLRLLAEIGIILLLFEVGLETDVRSLARTGGQSILVAVAGFILPFLFGFGIARGLLGLELLPSLFIGGTLTATSIGITVRVLADLKRQASTEGQVVLGAAVREPWPARWIIGTAMIPRGEFGLIFAERGRASGILDALAHSKV